MMKKSVFIEADVGRVGGEADVFLAVGFDEAARGKALESGVNFPRRRWMV